MERYKKPALNLNKSASEVQVMCHKGKDMYNQDPPPLLEPWQSQGVLAVVLVMCENKLIVYSLPSASGIMCPPNKQLIGLENVGTSAV